MFGFININKPSGMSSHKVISILRKITGIKQIGHAGTLDPIASGVLPVAIGKASKLIDYLPSDKSYIAGMYLGFESDTYDTDGIVKKKECKKVTKEQIEKTLEQFKGKIKQIPPAFSAVHYNGKRLYQLARAGNIPSDIPEREIIIYENKLLDFDYERQIVRISISCSKGTYIRSVVNDLGKELNTGAVMYELIRTENAGMKLSEAIELNDNLKKEDISKHIIKPQDVIPLEKVNLNEEEYKYVLNGNKFKNMHNAKKDILLLKDNTVVALAVADEEFIQPKKVLL